MRLIDADAFIEYLGLDAENAREDNIGEIVTLEDFDRQPTAFDKEKVIKELKKCADNSYDMWCAIDSEQDFGEAMAYKNAIKIVEKGGIE